MPPPSASTPRILGALAFAYASSGNRDDARTILEKLKPTTETDDEAVLWVAVVSGALGDTDTAFEWLENAYQRRSVWLRSLKSDFTYDPLRPDPRFKDLLRRMGLPP